MTLKEDINKIWRSCVNDYRLPFEYNFIQQEIVNIAANNYKGNFTTVVRRLVSSHGKFPSAFLHEQVELNHYEIQPIRSRDSKFNSFVNHVFNKSFPRGHFRQLLFNCVCNESGLVLSVDVIFPTVFHEIYFSNQKDFFPKNKNPTAKQWPFVVNTKTAHTTTLTRNVRPIDKYGRSARVNNQDRKDSRNIRRSTRVKIMARDSFRCVFCGRSPDEDGVKLEVDHIVPVAKGGSRHENNLQTLCYDCNRGKGAKIISIG
jgi:5-methylcytosine-specific restriction endonuclease McrA